MNARARSSSSRVIVAVGPSAADPLALAAAARLARAAGAELTALFVEDVNLLRLADLPFACDTSAASGISRRMAATEIERALKSQAVELRRTLIDVAGALRIDLRFEIARGRPVRVLLEASGQRDLVVLASGAVRTLTTLPAATIMRNALRVAAPRTPPYRPPPVMAMMQSADLAPRVLATAHKLALATGAELVTVLAGSATADAELSVTASAWHARHESIARTIVLPELTPENMAKLIATEGSHAFFWPGDEIPELVTDVETLLNAINCPLIVVR